MILENTTNERYLELKLQYYLELCGYVIISGNLEGNKPKDEKEAIICIVDEKPENKKENTHYFVRNNEKVISSDFIKELAADESDREALEKLCEIYDINMFKQLFSISSLYASRRKDYSKEEKLKKTVIDLADKCGEIRKYLLNEGVSWRLIYAYLYLVNKINEGLYKLRGYQYCAWLRLQDELNWLKKLRGNTEEILLLEADILSNTESSPKVLREAYKKLLEADSYSVRYHALYNLGDMELEKAERMYGDIYQDDKCKTLVELCEPVMYKFFLRCLEIIPSSIQPLYKLGLHHERKGLSEYCEFETAKSFFEKLKGAIEKIEEKNRTPLEFEYLYKAYLRLANVFMHQKDSKHAVENLEKARDVWKRLSKYQLFSEIYGEEEAREVVKILDNKYINRKNTFEYSYNELLRL